MFCIYKIHDYIVGRDEVGASAEDTPEEMKELLLKAGGAIV